MEWQENTDTTPKWPRRKTKCKYWETWRAARKRSLNTQGVRKTKTKSRVCSLFNRRGKLIKLTLREWYQGLASIYVPTKIRWTSEVTFLAVNLPRALFSLRAITSPTSGCSKKKPQQQPSAITAESYGKMSVTPAMEKGKRNDYL